MEVSKIWLSHLKVQKFVQIRTIKAIVIKFDGIEQIWNNIFMNNSTEIIIELQIAGGLNYIVTLGTTGESVVLSEEEKIEVFKKLNFEIANQLEHISKVIRKEATLKPTTKILEILEEIQENIEYYRVSVGLPKSRIGTLMLINLKNYQEKQVQSLIGIERVLGNYISNNKILGINLKRAGYL